MIFERFGKKKTSSPLHQATSIESTLQKNRKVYQRRQATPINNPTDIDRRAFIKNAGLFIAGAVTSGVVTKKLLSKTTEIFSDEKTPREEFTKTGEKYADGSVSEDATHVTPQSQLEPLSKESEVVTKERGPLDAYSFLDGESNTVEIPTGELAGNTFSDLYATYLGISDGAIVPETLSVDFKENLATLWRKKFALSKRSDNEQDTHKQLLFLKKNHNLMNLAEYLYRSYDVEQSHTMTLDKYKDSVTSAVRESRRVFTEILERKSAHSAQHEMLSKEKASLINSMGHSLTADTFLALSFTELMPSNNGDTNAKVFDFLLRNAGVDFIERIPSTHDMLESFGQYQITPGALSPNSAGSWAVQILSRLPPGFMPGDVDGLLRGKENTTAYVLAMSHIVQFVGTRNATQFKCLSDVMHSLSDIQRARAILSFVASSHHIPKDSYGAFDAFIWSMYINHAHSFSDDEILRHIPKGRLRVYTKKALANHQSLIDR